MNLAEATATWLLEQRRQQAISPTTIVCYRQDLIKILVYFGADSELTVLSVSRTRGFAAYLSGEGHSHQTCRRVLLTCRRLCDWMVMSGLLVESPFLHVEIPPDTYRGRRPSRYTLDDVEAIVGHDLTSVRDRSILRVIVDTGCAVTHLAAVTDDDLDMDRRQIRIAGTWHSITPATVAELVEYMRQRNDSVASSKNRYVASDRVLWISLKRSNYGKRMVDSGFRNLVKKRKLVKT